MQSTNPRNRKVIPAKFFATPVDGKRIFGLDLMRCCAVLMAIFFHGLYYYNSVLPKLPSYFYFIMMWAIVIFFVLSGFIIGSMIINMYLKGESFSFRNVFSFWKRRWIRTLPAYYLMLCVNIAFLQLPGFRGEGFSWLYFVFMQNFAWRPPTFFPETWSLAIEEWFYLLLPVTLALLVLLLAKRYDKKRIILVLIIVSIIIFTAFRFVYVVQTNPDFDWGLRKIVLYQLDGLIYGVLAAWVFRFYGEHFKRAKAKYFILGTASICIWYIIYRLAPANPYIKIFWFTFTSFGFSAMIPYMYYFNITARPLKAIITHTALLSYSCSLIYLTMIQQISLILYMPDSYFTGTVNFVGYTVIVLLLSTLMYNFFERPVLLLRK
jgi:peptidoglycan/LPS O-acetylase OafA/YrhL